jgi:hypothetical protein
MQDKSYRTTAALATRQNGAAPGWTRYTDANGIVQYEPIPVQPERPSEAHLAPRGITAIDMPTARQTVIHDKSTEVERSTAFVRFTLPLSLAMLAFTFVAALVGGLAALQAVGAAFFTFAMCWLGALIYYVSRSPAGTARHEANETWKLLRNEQAHRHEIEWFILEKHYGDNE